MSLVDIIKEIEAETEVKVEEIRANGQRLITEINRDSSQKLKLERERILTEAKVEAEKMIKRAYSGYCAKTNDAIADFKLNQLKAVYLKVEKDLSKITSVDYQNLMDSFWLQLSSFDKRTLKVFVAQDKERETRDFFEKKGIMVTGTIPGQGGFIAQDNEVEVDCTFKALIAKVKRETELEVVKILS